MSTATNNLWAREQARSGTAGSAGPMSAKKEKLRNEVVRDDWEDDDEEEEEEDDNPVAVGERNKQIWNEANSRESRSMPSVIISRGLSSTSSNLPLNEPPAMRILKRPSSSTTVPSNMNTIGESLQDREARYVAARERIFGISSSENKSTEEMQLHHHLGGKPSSSSSFIRELRGPTLADGTNDSSIKGFVRRRGEQSRNTVSPPSEDTSDI